MNKFSELYLLVHWNIQQNPVVYLKDEFENQGFKVKVIDNPWFKKTDFVSKWSIIRRWWNYYRLGIRTMRNTKPGDFIVALSFTAGISTAFLNKLFNRKRKVLLLNLIVRKKGKLNSLIRRLVYHYIFNHKNTIITVNTAELIEIYRKELNLGSAKFYPLPDCFNSLQYELRDYTPGKGYVFAGGASSRDWETLIKAASILPEIDFVFVARKHTFIHKTPVPQNVKVYFDVNIGKFNEIQRECSLVAVTVDEDVPAGLIVIITAAFLSKPVVATSTSCIKNYINAHNGKLVPMYDHVSLANEIKELIADDEKMKAYGESLQKYILENFSDTDYARKIVEIGNEIFA